MKTIVVSGQTLQLLPQRALYWPSARAMIVADLHLGKTDVFRARGVPVPAGSCEQTLARLEAAMAAVCPTKLIVLGDFVHAKESLSDGLQDTLLMWRRRHPALEILLVEGNHDRSAGRAAHAFYEALAITVVTEPYSMVPFALCHEPQPDAPGYVLHGHIHPCTVLRGSVDRLRVPCFVFDASRGILPAFGAFTGGYVVSAAAQEQIYAVADTRVVQIPAAQKRQF